MKHRLTPAEVQKNNDVDGELYHIAETHSFPVQERTFLTTHGKCPHCDEEAYSHRPGSVLAMGLVLVGVSALVGTAAFSIGVIGIVLSVMLTFVIENWPEKVHPSFSRVGL